jgi:hypothetical protein
MKKIIFLGALALTSLGCSDDKDSQPESTGQVVSGTVFDEGGQPLPNVSITFRTGVFGALTQTGTAETDAQGKYSALVDGKSGQTLLISARADGYVDAHQRSALSGTSALSASLTLTYADAMKCISGTCSGDGIALSGLPDGVVGNARAFDPTKEIDAFPGDFDAIEGDLLVSGGFVWVGLKDSTGAEISTLESPVRMDLEFQRASWPSVVDITPGNGQIDVPFYAFDENLGTWKRESSAVLVASSGLLLTEADAALLKTGDFAQRVYARGEVGHFSYWNIDWPLTNRSSTQIRFSPTATQAQLIGETTVGRSTGIPGGAGTANGGTGGASDPSVFCFDGPRSEKPDEDVDGDGIVGESATGTLIVKANGKFYKISKTRLSEASGDCLAPEGEISDVVLTDADLMATQMCTLTGVIKDLEDRPVVGSIVSARLSVQANEDRSDLCLSGDCVETSTTDSDGRYSLTIPVAGFTRVQGFGLITPPAGATSAFRGGMVRFEDCPSADVDIVADEGTDLYAVTITQTDDLISWDPPVSASRIFVTHSQQYLKWAVIGPMASPTTYGVVPGAAIQDIPSDGNPPREAIESGDLIRVFASEPGEGFYEKSYEGLLEVP